MSDVRHGTSSGASLTPACRCGRWQTYLGRWDEDGYTWRCYGCLRAIWRCTCAR